MAFTPDRTQLGLKYYDVGAVKDESHPTAVQRGEERGFKLKAHEKQPDLPLSPFYFDLRTSDNPKPGPLTPEMVTESGRELYQLGRERGLAYDHVVGLPNAGVPFAQALAEAARTDGRVCSVLTLHKQVASGGERHILGPVDGTFKPNERVLVIDDLITAADTKLEGITVLKVAGLVVEDIAVLIDRQQGGAKKLVEQGYYVHAVFPLDELTAVYVEHGRMKLSIRDRILAYVRDNQVA